ncbi:phosphatidylglycerophosphatase A [Synergistaceae bacterium OttesenSCG-928-I11]|nr:phosphatidylglycerophosphatase A [Synergistaceae bacterium OttesenSCG-928-I11]
MNDNETNTHWKTWYGLISTLFGLGNYSKMPGTLGTLAATIVLLVMGRVDPILLLATIAIGTVVADRYAKVTAKEDPGEVIIDEVAGYWVSMYGLDASYGIVAFFLFRIVDILKPFPVRTMERLPGGIGIMADDICGGVVVNILLRFLYWFFFAGGFTVLQNYLGIGG